MRAMPKRYFLRVKFARFFDGCPTFLRNHVSSYLISLYLAGNPKGTNNKLRLINDHWILKNDENKE